MLARKASFNQLTQNSLASIPDGSVGYGLSPHLGPTSPSRLRADDSMRSRGDIEVGDMVNVSAGLYGTVKFIGKVKGKAGVFVGVELESELAGKGKNDGAVDGVRYFTTSAPSSGVFVPLSRAAKRLSTSSSNPPPTPTLPNLPSPTGLSSLTPPTITPSRVRSESPVHRSFSGIGKPPTSRPSLPRPESPSSKGGTGSRPSLVPPTTPRHVSQGSRFGAPSPTPGKKQFGGRARAASISSNNGGLDVRPGTANGGQRIAQTPKPGYTLGLKQPKFSQMRSGSSLGLRSGSSMGRHQEDDIAEITEAVETSPIDSGIGMTRAEEMIMVNDEQISELKSKLEEKDMQLKEQTQSLLEMEATLAELQSLVSHASAPQHIMSPMSATSMRSATFEDADAAQLRALLREKNEKITLLTAEFDAHRADFRSTIDTLELASTETERVYEKRVEDLMSEIRELQDRNDDVESVARQLKQLEELVAELEEGLEDARRGEAEARAEVEFLRGEVERSKEELRREKEKSAAAIANAAAGKLMRNTADEVEKRDDEIRGLKAIIHSLSRDAVAVDEAPNGSGHTLERSNSLPNGRAGLRAVGEGEELAKERMIREKLEKEVAELEGLIETKVFREEELEKEIEILKKRRDTRNSSPSRQSIGPEPATVEKPIITTGTWTGRTSGDGTAIKDSGRESRATVSSWRSRQQPRSVSPSSRHLEAPVSDTLEESAANGSGGVTPLTTEGSDADGSVLWCEMCEVAGHDILTCTNMFGTAAGGPASAGPEGEKNLSAIVTDEDEKSAVSRTTSPGPVDDDALSVATEEDYKVSPSPSPVPPAVTEKQKTVHLPTPPPMVESSFGPAAGKASGVVDMNKWCALCERDGHDSVDCPLEDDF
ncbi:hypothetical protein RUND412_005563 [Rhizina undulata]